MENYFILLELPFDLPESDTNKISEATKQFLSVDDDD